MPATTHTTQAACQLALLAPPCPPHNPAAQVTFQTMSMTSYQVSAQNAPKSSIVFKIQTEFLS